VVANAVSYVRGIVPSADRELNDFYQTPPEGTRALLAVERFHGPIWEPACGDGSMSRVLEEAGHHVVSTDLVDRGYGTPRVDFLLEHERRAPNIVTNPPFKNAEEFALHALRLSAGKVAMLCRLAWLEGDGRRRRIFAQTPIARVWVFSRRLRMQRGRQMLAGESGGMQAFAWFVWEHGHAGPPALGWLE
jgi:hypothetical protein